MITAWTTPPAADKQEGAALQEFLPHSFPTTRNTLYLMSRTAKAPAHWSPR